MATAVHRRIGVLVGSLRSGSFSRLIAKAMVARAPMALECRFIDIRSLPVCGPRIEPVTPPSWRAFRRSVREVDGLLFVTPDYHAAMPECLTNAIEIASAADGTNLLRHKPAAVVSVSPYPIGGQANDALSELLDQHGMALMPRPHGHVGKVANVMSADGRIKGRKTDAFLGAFMAAFDQWIGKQWARERGDNAEIDGVVAWFDPGTGTLDRQASLFPS